MKNGLLVGMVQPGSNGLPLTKKEGLGLSGQSNACVIMARTQQNARVTSDMPASLVGVYAGGARTVRMYVSSPAPNAHAHATRFYN